MTTSQAPGPTAYRDTFRLLLRYAQRETGKPPVKLALTDFDVTQVLGFLNYLETERHNTVRSRNARLAAVRAFAHYVSLQCPPALQLAQQILAIPMKRFEKSLLRFLSRDEVQAVLAAASTADWCGRRDRIMLSLLYNTGARVHGLDAAYAHRIELCLVDRLEQGRSAVHQARQPGAADVDAVVAQALLLAIQGLVIEELVHHQARDEAHIGTAVVEHPGRGGSTMQALIRAQLDHPAHVLEDDVTAGPLGQAVADLLADDLELVLAEALQRPVGRLDELHRHALVEEQRHLVLVFRRLGAGWPAGVGADELPRGRCHPLFGDPSVAQAHLRRGDLQQASLGLLAEDLPLEPLELVSQPLQALLQLAVFLLQLRPQAKASARLEGAVCTRDCTPAIIP